MPPDVAALLDSGATTKPLPCKPGDWLADSGQRVARVKDVYWGGGEALVDLVLYTFDGTKTGRESPPEGGPRSYEPACSFANWHRVPTPEFPIELRWVTGDDGVTTAQRDAGPALPDRAWVRPPRRGGRKFTDDRLRRALEEIAAGHNDARGLAQTVLGIKHPSPRSQE